MGTRLIPLIHLLVLERSMLFLVCFILLVLRGLPTALSQSNDAPTLLVLKQNLTDPQGRLANWNLSTQLCQWYGVHCHTGTNQVMNLTLAKSSLGGTVSPAIGRLSLLMALDLSGNNLTGPIPQEIINCTHLVSLNLGENNLSGSLPQNLDQLVNLTNLLLEENIFGGGIPSSIGSLLRLQRLRLYSNRLTGSIPKEIGNCTSLKFLQLYDNMLDGPIPPELGKLRKLTHLSLSRNQLTEGIPKEIGSCSSLQRFSLSGNPLGGQLVPELGQLYSLRYFDASDCNLTGSFPRELGNNTKLQEVDVSINSISGTLQDSLGNNWNFVRLLNLSMNNLTGNIPTSFGKMINLQSLDVSFNNFTGDVPMGLGQLPNVSKLLLSSNRFEGALPRDLGILSNLNQLKVSNNRFSGTIPLGLCTRNNLKLLSVSNNHFTGGLTTALADCSSMNTFEASNNGFNGPLPAFLDSLSLVHLDISSNQLDGSIPAQVGQLFNLQHLDISGNMLSGNVPDLKRLGNLLVFNVSRNALSGTFPSFSAPSKLQVLDLSYNNFSGNVPEDIGTKVSELRNLDLSNNNFSGPIPQTMADITGLQEFNFSNNHFNGRIPVIKAFSEGPATAFANNPGLCGTPLSLQCSSPPSPPPPSGLGRRRKRAGRILGLVFLLLAGLVLGSGAIFLFCGYRGIHRKRSARVQENKYADRVPTIYAEVEKATEGFSEDNIIGIGPHGTVYKAIYAWEKILAVKVLRTQPEMDEKRKYYYIAAARKLTRIHHPNIVKLEDFLIYGGSRLFLYQYMPNKSLGELLHAPSGPKLHWNTRYKIAVGAAQGLSYLHQCSIIHCDIKSRNIMLDVGYGAHIGDMALAKLIKDERQLSAVDRYSGYAAPEAAKISLKGDVYSFGIVLLELLTGRNPILEDGRPLASWVRTSLAEDQPLANIVDPLLRNVNGPFHEEINSVCKIALACTDPLPNRRPTMKDVVDVLTRIKREPGGPKLRSLRSFIHSRSFILLSSHDDD